MLVALVAGVAFAFAVRSKPRASQGSTTAPCAKDADCGPKAACGKDGRCVARRAGCSTNRACVAASGGKPAICRKDDGVCVPLETDACRVLAEPGDVENDATIWLGAMFRVQGRTFGQRAANTVELARRDFARTSGGLLPPRPGGAKRPIAVVLCDDGKDAAQVAAHLVNDVRVPALLGFGRSKEVLDLAPSLFLPRGVLALASNAAPTLRDIPRAPGGARLIWRLATGTEDIAAAIAALLTGVLEPGLRKGPGALPPGERLSVALVRGDNILGQAYADTFVSTLRYNGRSVAENGDGFRQIVVAHPQAGDDRSATQRVANEVVAARPRVVIVVGTTPRCARACWA